ncbi:cobalamin biosynthesis protein [Trichormus azollae]|jgi:cobalamin biosynthesis protein CbiG|uniref:Cobalamin (Vitamin B12) biosynthesis CbiG protein n=1 Tax=Nostoc azollae (strain 0708) TaxID=551115 RepID=D7E5H8_NOSA0|nr:cobalamin biosynthesis protein [Trichormus azollae]ADI65538.1 cobalamin (vitamin B12) biosynthesis CbiG protein ['Nostoc azollae' 0708]
MQVELLNSQVLWVGIGCQKGTSGKLISIAIENILLDTQFTYSAIAGIATIESKASEMGLREFCRVHNFPLKTFTAEILAGVNVPNPAKIIAQIVGTPSVAEASAILAATEISSQMRLLVPKQIFRLPEDAGVVTVAIAQRV